MDKIWDRKSFEVGGCWPLWRGWKNKWPRRTDKSWTLKIKNKKSFLFLKTILILVFILSISWAFDGHFVRLTNITTLNVTLAWLTCGPLSVPHSWSYCSNYHPLHEHCSQFKPCVNDHIYWPPCQDKYPALLLQKVVYSHSYIVFLEISQDRRYSKVRKNSSKDSEWVTFWSFPFRHK